MKRITKAVYFNTRRKRNIRITKQVIESKIFNELLSGVNAILYFNLIGMVVRGNVSRDKKGAYIYNKYYCKGHLAVSASQNHMSKYFGIKQSEISRGLSGLCDKGLVSVVKEVWNGRSCNVYIVGHIVDGKEITFLDELAMVESDCKSKSYMKQYVSMPFDFLKSGLFKELLLKRIATTYFLLRAGIIRKSTMTDHSVDVYTQFYKNGKLATRISQIRIAKHIGRHVHTVSEHFRKLNELGYIEREYFDDTIIRACTRCVCVLGEMDHNVVGPGFEKGAEAYFFDTRMVNELKKTNDDYKSFDDYVQAAEEKWAETQKYIAYR